MNRDRIGILGYALILTALAAGGLWLASESDKPRAHALSQAELTEMRGAFFDGFLQECRDDTNAPTCSSQQNASCSPMCKPVNGDMICKCCNVDQKPENCFWAASPFCTSSQVGCGDCMFEDCIEVEEPAGWVCPTGDCNGPITGDDCIGEIRVC